MLIVLVCVALFLFLIMFVVCYIDRDCCFYFFRQPKVRDYTDRNDIEMEVYRNYVNSRELVDGQISCKNNPM